MSCSDFTNELSATIPYPEPSGANLAFNRPVTVSSVENNTFGGANAADGNTTTRWSSQYADPQSLQVDLGSVYSIDRVVLRWETAAAGAYQIRVSLDGVNFTTPYTTTSEDGELDDISLEPVAARYVQMYGTERLTPWGYSLWELEVYGTPVVEPPPVAAFRANIRSGSPPLSVIFADESSDPITDRSWSFGDGGTSSATTAVHTYSTPGTYTVSLTVSGPGGTDTLTEPAYINVAAPAAHCGLCGQCPRRNRALDRRVSEFIQRADQHLELGPRRRQHRHPIRANPYL